MCGVHGQGLDVELVSRRSTWDRFDAATDTTDDGDVWVVNSDARQNEERKGCVDFAEEGIRVADWEEGEDVSESGLEARGEEVDTEIEGRR